MNRCFNPPYESPQSRLAASILDLLEDFGPEAVVDTHNTSAHSEPFAVSAADSPQIRQITQLFTRKLVVIDQKLGTLIETNLETCPTVTVEFGGFMEPKADTIAEETLLAWVRRKQLFDADLLPLQILKHPLRLEMEPGYHVHYSSSVQDDADITLFNTIDQLNFSPIPAHTSLGWLGRSGIKGLKVITMSGENIVSELFADHKGFLVTTQPMTLFMATTDPYIAQRDCLLYLTPDQNIQQSL